MTDPVVDRLFVCLVHGLDCRSIDANVTPFIHSLQRDFPSLKIRTQPMTDLLATLLTGVGPHEHGMWQVTLNRNPTQRLRDRLYCRLPDSLVTTLQCLRHALRKDYDLPAVPFRRRRHFNLHRLRYVKEHADEHDLSHIGPVPSLFASLGENSRYTFAYSDRQMQQIGQTLPIGDRALEMVETYGLDIYEHWHLDQPEKMRLAHLSLDHCLHRAYQRCQTQGQTFLLISDHGQEQVHHRINLRKLLRDSGVPESEYHYYLEVPTARFWFKTPRARQTISDLLRTIANVNVRSYQQMQAYDMCFTDDRFGELFAITDQGCIFYPHDFSHPVGNIFMGLTQSMMRPRLRDPAARGYHGHLPDHPAEDGLMILADHRFHATSPRMKLTDFAPTVLALLGQPQPPSMRGNSILCADPRREPAAPEWA
jgi:hypothetical protein